MYRSKEDAWKLPDLVKSDVMDQSQMWNFVFICDIFGSRPSDHYFRSVCLSVCAEFFSAVFDPISIKLGHMLYVWV